MRAARSSLLNCHTRGWLRLQRCLSFVPCPVLPLVRICILPRVGRGGPAWAQVAFVFHVECIRVIPFVTQGSTEAFRVSI